jgi:hypothetical protein
MEPRAKLFYEYGSTGLSVIPCQLSAMRIFTRHGLGRCIDVRAQAARAVLGPDAVAWRSTREPASSSSSHCGSRATTSPCELAARCPSWRTTSWRRSIISARRRRSACSQKMAQIGQVILSYPSPASVRDRPAGLSGGAGAPSPGSNVEPQSRLKKMMRDTGNMVRRHRSWTEPLNGPLQGV